MTRNPPAPSTGDDPRIVSERFLGPPGEESGLRHFAGFVVAGVSLHLALFLVVLPGVDPDPPAVPEPVRTPVTIHRLVLTPPPPERPEPPRREREITQRLPVPAVPDQEVVPIIRVEAPLFPDAPPDLGDVTLELPAADALPAPGPAIPGLAGVSQPERISTVDPEYPTLGRVARVEGRVTLRAVIRKDGTVTDIEVLSEPASNLGFADAARAAVSRWRYRPATQDGRPVDVYFTVVVNFTLD